MREYFKSDVFAIRDVRDKHDGLDRGEGFEEVEILVIVGIVSVGEALQLPYEKLKNILSRSGKKKGKKNVSPANQNA